MGHEPTGTAQLRAWLRSYLPIPPGQAYKPARRELNAWAGWEHIPLWLGWGPHATS